MNDAAFANAFAISHVAPGPNSIMVSLIGWQLAGMPVYWLPRSPS
jgi:chromate transporter